MSAWQPMETAPKDGTAILAVVDGEVEKVAWEIVGADGWQTGWWLAHTDNEYYKPVEPTCWMPLPELPE